MSGGVSRLLFILSLGLALVLGWSSSALHADGRAATSTSLSAEMKDAGRQHREGCGHVGGQGQTNSCQLPCASVAPALLPPTALLPTFTGMLVLAPQSGLLTGRTTRPDPHPPKRPAFV